MEAARLIKSKNPHSIVEGTSKNSCFSRAVQI